MAGQRSTHLDVVRWRLHGGIDVEGRSGRVEAGGAVLDIGRLTADVERRRAGDRLLNVDRGGEQVDVADAGGVGIGTVKNLGAVHGRIAKGGLPRRIDRNRRPNRCEVDDQALVERLAREDGEALRIAGSREIVVAAIEETELRQVEWRCGRGSIGCVKVEFGHTSRGGDGSGGRAKAGCRPGIGVVGSDREGGGCRYAVVGKSVDRIAEGEPTTHAH